MTSSNSKKANSQPGVEVVAAAGTSSKKVSRRMRVPPAVATGSNP
jgi:hypothetical protein